MATGDTLAVFLPGHIEPPSSNYAEIGFLTSDTGIREMLLFDDGTDETAIFSGVMPRNYDGGGITIKIWYSMDSANTSDNVIFDAAFEKISEADGMGTSGADFAAVNSVTDTAEDAADDITSAEIAFTNGADMDSVTAGDPFRFKLTRDADNASDTAAGDAQVHRIEIRET